VIASLISYFCFSLIAYGRPSNKVEANRLNEINSPVKSFSSSPEGSVHSSCYSIASSKPIEIINLVYNHETPLPLMEKVSIEKEMDGISNETNKLSLEPIAEDRNFNSVLISLTNTLSVSEPFQIIDNCKFCFFLLCSKTNVIAYGDYYPGIGYFACCGYSTEDQKNIQMFFVDESFQNSSSMTISNYLKKKLQPIGTLSYDKVSLSVCSKL